MRGTKWTRAPAKLKTDKAGRLVFRLYPSMLNDMRGAGETLNARRRQRRHKTAKIQRSWNS